MSVEQLMADRLNVIEVVNNVAIYADLHQWDELRTCFADELEIDYTSLVGGKPARINADDLIPTWEKSLSQYKATQHMLSNHRVAITDDTAQCFVYVQATHWLPQAQGSSVWIVNGSYDYILLRSAASWKITHSRLNTLIVRGPHALLQLAGVRSDLW